MTLFPIKSNVKKIRFPFFFLKLYYRNIVHILNARINFFNTNWNRCFARLCHGIFWMRYAKQGAIATEKAKISIEYCLNISYVNKAHMLNYIGNFIFFLCLSQGIFKYNLGSYSLKHCISIWYVNLACIQAFRKKYGFSASTRTFQFRRNLHFKHLNISIFFSNFFFI